MITTTIVRGAHLGAVFAAALLSVPSLAQVVQFGVDVPAVTDSRASIVTNGTVAYTISTIDPFGTNPGLRKQIFRWDIATGSGSQVTSYGEGVENVSVSNDGTWLAFVSNADLLGTNHDESPELYVMRSDGTDLAQLTSSNLLPRPFPRGITRAVISGSANRIVFMGGINPLGTNPTLSNAVFVIDRDGTNLRQLDVNLGDLVSPLNIDSGDVIDISDDGSKVVYTKANQLNGINADGTGLHTFPSSTSVREAAISGNGSKVVWAVGQQTNASFLRASTFVQPGTVVNLGGGYQPSITDDGAVVYYNWVTAAFGIYRISSTGGSATFISSTSGETLRVSGGGTRLVGTNSTGLFSMDNTGGNVQQLTQAPFGYGVLRVDALSPDGSRAWFLASPAPGSNLLQLSTYDFNTGTRVNLTDAWISDLHFRVSDAGDVVFVTNGNPTGQNPGGTNQVFKISAAGTISQLTFSPTFDGTRWPVIRGDGQEIVFQGAPVAGGQNLYRMNGDGTGVTMVVAGSKQNRFAISEGSPAWLVYPSPVGVGSIPLYRVRTDGSGGQFITPAPDPCDGVSISGDGNRVAFVSKGDFVGQNADHSDEAFLYDATTGLITQLTHDVGGIYETRMTRDGQHVFVGDMKIAVDTGVVEPTAGFLHTSSLVTSVAPNVTGSAWAFSGAGIIDRNPNDPSLFRVVTTVAPKIQVGKESPTVLTWDASPGSLRYDVVRGSVANLTVVGSTVDLGPVSCLEDDSPDNHTLGHGDPADPAPGEAFFYVYRGSIGFNAAVGSYGQGTGGRERVAGAGGCNP